MGGRLAECRAKKDIQLPPILFVAIWTECRVKKEVFEMQVGYFTERPYRWIPDEEILRNRGFFAISNRFYDREKASDDYHYYLDEYCYAEDLGFDLLALNEHHGNPICMGSVMNV